MWGEAAKALKVIREVCPDVTPDQITAAGAAHRAEWPKASCSPSSLAKHWSKFGPQKKERGAGGGSQVVLEPQGDWQSVARVKLGMHWVQDGEPWVMMERAQKVKIVNAMKEARP